MVGGSYGGMVALAFAERDPERVSALAIVSAADRPHPMAIALAQHSAAHLAVCDRQRKRTGRDWKLARAIGMSLYRSPEEFSARFPAIPTLRDGRFAFRVERYLFRDSTELDGFTAEPFLRLSESLDLHQVDAGRIFVPTTAV